MVYWSGDCKQTWNPKKREQGFTYAFVLSTLKICIVPVSDAAQRREESLLKDMLYILAG